MQQWHLVKCKRCTLIFLSPQPNEAQLKQLYEHESYYTDRIQKEPSVDRAQQRAERLRPLIAKLEQKVGRKGRLLGIGCGYGMLLGAAKASGWDAMGLEVSSHAAQFVKSAFDIDVIEAPANALNSLDIGTFDAITMFSVIEHLPDPISTLTMVRQRLKPDGLLWAVVPNVNSMDRFWHGPYWSGWDVPYHLWHFSPKTITQLLNTAGFEQINTENVFFNPITHLRIAAKQSPFRQDVRQWQLKRSTSSPPPMPQVKSSSQTKQKARPLLKQIKRVFSERDMHVWARPAK